MEADRFVFTQEDLTKTSFSVFEEMRRNGELVDFKITIQDRIFLGHRLILSAAIPYLRTMFAGSVNEIPLEGIDTEIFEDVINFAYSGKITITTGNVQSLLVASKLLNMTKVEDACLKYMSLRINVGNVFQIRSFAGNIQSLRLAAACDRCILRNFEDFVSAHSFEFLQLPFPYLKEIVGRDDLNVSNEEKVFEAITKWVRASHLERHCVLPELFSSVRLKKLSPQFLVEKVSSEELVRLSAPCMFLLEETKNYHLLPNKPAALLASVNSHPRNTTGHGLYSVCSSTLGTFVELYDAEKEIWITLAPLSSDRVDHAVGFNGKIYLFRNNSDEIAAFDTKTLKKEPLNVSGTYKKTIASFEQIVLHTDKFYAFCMSSREVLGFDPTLKVWLGVKATLNREDSSIVSMGEYIYITGGYINGSTSKCCIRYTPSTGAFKEITPMLVARRRHGCAALKGKVYVCGGLHCKQQETAELYDPVTDQWSFISPMRTAERSIFLAAYKGRLYAFGSDATEVYDPEHDEWKMGVPTPSSCKFSKFVAIPL